MASASEILESFSSLGLFILGSVLIAVSAGVGMTSAFNSRPLIVYPSFVVFILGYKIAQTGYHNGIESYRIFLTDLGQLKNHKTSLISFLGGSLFISLGFVLLGMAVTQLSIVLGLSSGAVIGGGYILSHWAVNNRLV